MIPLDNDTFGFRSTLTDESFGGDYGTYEQSKLIHEFAVTGAVDRDLMVLELAAEVVTHPYPSCPLAADICPRLVGLSISSGWRRAVLGLSGGGAGCTHLTTVLLGLSDLTTLSFFLRMNRRQAYTDTARADGRWMAVGLDLLPQIGDACHVLRTDGDVLSTSRRLRDSRS